MPQGEETEVKDIANMTSAEIEAHIESNEATFKSDIERRKAAHKLSQRELAALAKIRKTREAAV